jgi:hypothetical protein
VCRGPEGANAVMRLSPAAQDELWRCAAGGRGAEAAPGWASLKAVPSVVRRACVLLDANACVGVFCVCVSVCVRVCVCVCVCVRERQIVSACVACPTLGCVCG